MYSLNFSKKKYDILILDDGQVDFKLQSYNFYIINFKSINFFVFIISLLKFLKSNKDKLSFKEIYKQNLYRHFKPKIIISHHLNNRSFEAKYLCPEIITMTYQFGFINEHARFLKDRPKKYCETDYFFVFHEIDKKIFEKTFSSNFIVSGSARNNSFSLEKINNKKYFITYISEFKKKPKIKNNNIYLYEKNVYEYQTKIELFVLNILKDICQKNGKKLRIALRSNRQDKKHKLKKSEEISYYKGILGYTPEIDGNENSYQVGNNSKLSICLGSNLGIELISRDLMVFFINIFSNYNKAQTIPYFTINDSLLVCSKENSEIIRKKISNLLNLDIQDFKNEISKYFRKILFDPNNKIIKNKIDEILKNENIYNC